MICRASDCCIVSADVARSNGRLPVGIAMGAVKHLRERRVKQRLLKSI
jgi:hypothetical protein